MLDVTFSLVAVWLSAAGFAALSVFSAVYGWRMVGADHDLAGCVAMAVSGIAGTVAIIHLVALGMATPDDSDTPN